MMVMRFKIMPRGTKCSEQYPASLSDDQITKKVYKTHVLNAEKYDVGPLWNVVYNIVKRTTQIADSLTIRVTAPLKHNENKGPISQYFLNPPLRLLKQIAVKMMDEAQCTGSADITTMWILEELKSYPWDAKAVLTLAAFALNYGNFWYLTQINPTTDSFGNLLALLNRVAIVKDPQSNDTLRQAISEVNSLIKTVLQVIECIIELETLSSKAYDTEEDPELADADADAMRDIALASYWAIITIVVCAFQFEFVMGASCSKVYLYPFVNKLPFIPIQLMEQRANINKHIEEFEVYLRHKKVLQTLTEIVEVLKILIYPDNTQDHQVFDGNVKKMVSIEVFRHKHALLFVSDLDSISNKFLLLDSIHKGLMEDPEEVKGYKKKDYKILWIPMVDDWNPMQKEIFTMWKSKMPWYVLEYVLPLAGIKLIRDVLGYKNKPIVPLMNPQGKIINSNALHMMFVWDMEAFPFRPEDDEHLSQKFKWFWSPLISVFQQVRVWIKEDKYIFIYGGNPEWMESFAKAMEAIKVHENKKRVDVVIECYPLGKNDSKYANQFWDDLEILFRENLLKKPHDLVLRDILEVLCLKHDRKGWIVLSKGSNIKLLGQGDPALHIAKQFEDWKGLMLERVGFDVAFREYYEKKLRESPPQCAFMQLAFFPSYILEPISCPNVKCGHLMDIANVIYECCHDSKPNELEKGDDVEKTYEV